VLENFSNRNLGKVSEEKMMAVYSDESVTNVTCFTKVKCILYFRDETYGFSKSDLNFMDFFVGPNQCIDTNFQWKYSSKLSNTIETLQPEKRRVLTNSWDFNYW